MNLLSLFLSSTIALSPAQPEGRYVAVTETEFQLELTLQSSGRAELKRRLWEADGSAPGSRTRLDGRWILRGTVIDVSFPTGRKASFNLEPCLAYEEFGSAGCSIGLKLIRTDLSPDWGLQRFGLWRSDQLRP